MFVRELTVFVCSSRPPPTLWPLWTCSSLPASVHTQLTYQNHAVDPKGGRHLAATTLGPLHSRSCGTDFFSFVSLGRKQTSGSIHTSATAQHSSSAVGAQQPCLTGTGTCGSSDVLTTPVSVLVSAHIRSALPQRHPNPRRDDCWCDVPSAPIGGWLPSPSPLSHCVCAFPLRMDAHGTREAAAPCRGHSVVFRVATSQRGRVLGGVNGMGRWPLQCGE
jgi:hypothetical protein